MNYYTYYKNKTDKQSTQNKYIDWLGLFLN